MDQQTKDDGSLPLRLRGGGESSLSNGTTAWGTPSTQAPNNSNDNVVWGQMGSKAQANNTLTSSNQPGGSPQNTSATSSSTKQQLEQLQTLRDAIFSQDGWGVQFVNQDTSWDIPGSPEPQNKPDGTNNSTSWKAPVNNGTELWEANLRNGGQPPAQPQQKAPWGHTPSNNIGGTWGEEDDTDSSSVWTGGNPNQPPWSASGNTNNNPMWNGSQKEDEWNTNTTNNWRESRSTDRQIGEIRPGLRVANNSETARLLDNREPVRQIPNEIRGDPRGITGRLSGAGADSFWGQTNQVGAQQPMPHHKIPGPANGTGWDETSSNLQKRNTTNYDDGTSLWGNPQHGSHWKDLPAPGNIGRSNVVPSSIGMTQVRMKPEATAWGNGRNSSWEEIGNQSVPWEEHNSWVKQKMSNPLWENDLEWVQKTNKLHLTKEMIWNSKQFRMLVDMGHKKEDVENALRLREMNMDEALELLNALRRVEHWGNRHEDHYESQSYANHKYPLGPNMPMSNFPMNNDPNLLNSIPNPVNNNSSLLNNLSSAFVQKMLLQGSGGHQGLGNNPNIAARNVPPQPSSQHLKILVSQIQMAVQAGFLSNQILNQPLAPQTLALLNQLLQQIKTFHQLATQQNILSTYTNGKQNNAYMQYTVLIAKTKQTISNIQNQISNQQTAYLKQQMGDVMKPTMMHDSISTLQNNFADLGINKEPPANQQSKLNQWINKDKDGNEFSRAPGSTSKLTVNVPFGMNQADGPWSTGRSADRSWPEGTPEVNNEKEPQWASASQQSITDLVPEFEPGKPWKGNQLKSIEDDPTITPGSVVRSPLSIPTIKEGKMFNMNPNKSPPTTDGMQTFGLNSSTWSNNTPISSATTFPGPSGQLQPANGSFADSSATPTMTSDLWAAPKQSKVPPGLTTENNWSNNTNSTSWGSGHRNSGNWVGSTWLLLKNLTAQIDGSTLRTLCMQHGPLISFNLYLYQGVALAKYTSREEATKAQATLNNCVLGNTTILAENPTDWDANILLQQLATQQNGSSGNWRGSSKQTSAEPWNTGWPNNPSSTLWSTPLDCSDPRGTPSNLNSFLPNDLLGGESI